jgi:DNA-binding response OmpR family regulator
MARSGGRSKRRAVMARHAVSVSEPHNTEPRKSPVARVRTVLVVASDSVTGGKIVGALQRRGFAALQGSTVPLALYWARREPPALVILDARMEGWRRLAAELRREGRAVIVLTDDRYARAAALEAGCLDEGMSGLDPETLALRVGVLVGRGWASESVPVAAGPLVVDLRRHHLVWGGRRMEASWLLLRLAAYLAAHSGQIVPTKVLLEDVWGEPWANPNKVHQAVWRLRHLLGESANSSFLVGRQRHGYALLPMAEPPRSSENASGF